MSKITKSIQCELSEKANSFLKTRLILEKKKLASFIKTRFYWQQDCIKMRKYEEMFQVNKG